MHLTKTRASKFVTVQSNSREPIVRQRDLPKTGVRPYRSIVLVNLTRNTVSKPFWRVSAPELMPVTVLRGIFCGDTMWCYDSDSCQIDKRPVGFRMYLINVLIHHSHFLFCMPSIVTRVYINTIAFASLEISLHIQTKTPRRRHTIINRGVNHAVRVSIVDLCQYT